MEHLLTSEAISALLTLTFLEIVLGIDNLIFISIITQKLSVQHQKLATNIDSNYLTQYCFLLWFYLNSSGNDQWSTQCNDNHGYCYCCISRNYDGFFKTRLSFYWKASFASNFGTFFFNPNRIYDDHRRAHLSETVIFNKEVGTIPKGYLYFAISFSLGIKFLNMKLKGRKNN